MSDGGVTQRSHLRRRGPGATLLRLLGVGVAYGVGFMFIKSLFPEPFVLLILEGGHSSDGNLTKLALVYMLLGLISGLVAAPLFGGIMYLRGSSAAEERPGSRLILSLLLALLTGLISGILTIVVYAIGILPPGGVLDPLRLIRSSVHHAPGESLLTAWTIARDLLPASMAGLFLSPILGATLQRLYTPARPPEQKTYEEYDV